MDTIEKIELLRTPEYKRKLMQCIHCGLCLQACPTYAVFSTEMDAPRGRIAFIRAAADGKIGADDFRTTFTRHIQLCLACRSCETACPSGVKYGEIIETARIVVEQNRKIGVGERLLRWLGTRQLMLNPAALKMLARLLWVYERLGLQAIFRALPAVPTKIRSIEQILPPIQSTFTKAGRVYPAIGDKHGQVLFFLGCIQEAFLAPINQATIRVLQKNGYDVFVPEDQTCCGAAHLHLGDVDTAMTVARQNIAAFGKYLTEYDAVVNNAGGCGASLKEYPYLLRGKKDEEKTALEFSQKVKDISEFLIEKMTNPPSGKLDMRVTYSDSCHLRNAQKIIKPPRELLKRIPGVQLVEMHLPDHCCGSAGVYNIAQADTAAAILESKMADIFATAADVIATSNTGCYMQLAAGARQEDARRSGKSIRVMHVVEILDLSYQVEDKIVSSSTKRSK